MNRYSLLICGLLLGVVSKLSAQERYLPFPFSQPSQISPSLTGVMDERVRLSLTNFNFRVVQPQRQNAPSDEVMNYSAFYFNADKGFENKWLKGGLGLRLSTENFAGLRYNKGYLAFAYAVPLGYKRRYTHLRFGIQAGFVQMALGDDPLIFEDQFRQRGFSGSSAERLPQLSTAQADLSASLLFYKSQKIIGNPELNYFAGLTLHHLNRPIWGFFDGIQERLPIRYVAFAGMKYRLRKPFDYNLTVLLYQQRSQTTFGGQFYARYLLYKKDDHFSDEQFQFSLGFNYIHYQLFTPIFAIGYHQKYHLAIAYNLMTDRADFLPNIAGGINVAFSYYFSPQRKQLMPDDRPPKELSAVPFPEF
jgi:type IX secretion system PorP/SprF family membrane protein